MRDGYPHRAHFDISLHGFRVRAGDGSRITIGVSARVESRARLRIQVRVISSARVRIQG